MLPDTAVPLGLTIRSRPLMLSLTAEDVERGKNAWWII